MKRLAAILNSRIFFALSGGFLIALLIFTLRMLAVRKNWYVWQKTAEYRDIAKSLTRTGRVLPPDAYFLRSRNASEQRFLILDSAAIAPGLLAITRFDAESAGYVIELLDTDWSVLHRWTPDYSRLVEGGSSSEFPHATRVLRDGTVLVSFDGGTALARLDACSEPMWVRNDQVYHHTLQADTEGFWIWRATVNADGHDQSLLRFDVDTGADLEVINLIDDVVLPSPESALIAAIPEGFAFERETWSPATADVFHPNDIEPLPAELADAFPQFKTGDLLISLRNIGLVAVLDRKTKEFLWSMRGPWVRQHDPDWQADGSITVYNNNSLRNRSNIMKIDLETKTVTMLFPGGGPSFYSVNMGDHQRLVNGNWLILSPKEGRVIEVTDTGAKVREYSNIVNEKYNAVLPNAEYLPVGYFPDLPNCGR